MSNGSTPEDVALEGVQELFKTIAATAGIMLALLWGLTQRPDADVLLPIIQWSSIILVMSLCASLLGLQFIVSEAERGRGKITKSPRVAYSYLVAWPSFLVGCIFLIVAIFRV